MAAQLDQGARTFLEVRSFWNHFGASSGWQCCQAVDPARAVEVLEDLISKSETARSWEDWREDALGPQPICLCRSRSSKAARVAGSAL